MAGASTRSVATKPYAKPRLRRPRTRMKWYAMRVPSPVFTKAVAMKNAATASQTTVLPNPAVASADRQRAGEHGDARRHEGGGAHRHRAQDRCRPSWRRRRRGSCHARGSTPAGAGMSQMAAPARTTTASRAASTRAVRAVRGAPSSAMRHRNGQDRGAAGKTGPAGSSSGRVMALRPPSPGAVPRSAVRVPDQRSASCGASLSHPPAGRPYRRTGLRRAAGALARCGWATSPRRRRGRS